MFATDRFRLRQSVGIVHQNNVVEFFCANTRQLIRIKTAFPDIVALLQLFDGENSIDDVVKSRNDVNKDQLMQLVGFLNANNILIRQDASYPGRTFADSYRLINLLEDYFSSTRDVICALEKLKRSNVMIVGLGAVGSLIATYLARSGVENFVFVDDDSVDSSNLHRQCYFENQVGIKKADALAANLKDINPNIKILPIRKNLTEDFFIQETLPGLSLIVNCADEPSVDVTSRIVARYAMQHEIPHIVGGGYNLHLTLIGQSIIPFETACLECFNSALKNLNNAELKGVRRLHRENRKLGSFSPLSGMASALASLDAFKILIGRNDLLQQCNKRIEFSFRDERFNVIDIPRNPECEWCAIR